jgi:pimeloyl-ACP methyl ester carboxylesterase
VTSANGLTFHTQILGNDGTPVVMLHGLFGSVVTWYFTAGPSIARTHRVLMYDLRGHGKSARTPSGYDLQTMTADLAELITGFADGPVSLVGHSFGGAIALQYALQNPQRVACLALVEVPMPPSNVDEIASLVKRSPEELIAALPDRTRLALMRGERGRKGERNLEAIRLLVFETTLLQDVGREPDFADATLSHLRCPALCVYGETSSCLPAGRRLSQVLPDAKLVVLPGGHYLPVDCPALLTSTLVEFLNG